MQTSDFQYDHQTPGICICLQLLPTPHTSSLSTHEKIWKLSLVVTSLSDLTTIFIFPALSHFFLFL